MNTDKMDKSYDRLFRHVFTPILGRYGVLPQDRPYIMAFHAVLLASSPRRVVKFPYKHKPMFYRI